MRKALISRNKSIVRGLLSDYFIYFLIVLVGFVSVPIYLKFLSIQEYGLWLSALALLGLLTLIDPGVDTYLITELSSSKIEIHEKGIITNATIMKWSLIPLHILIYIFFIFFGDEFHKHVNNNLFTLPLFISMILTNQSNTFVSILNAKHQYSATFILSSISTIFSPFFSIILLNLNLGLDAMSLGYFLATFLMYISCKLYLKYCLRFDASVSINLISISTIKKIFRFSKHIIVFKILNTIRTSGQQLMISNNISNLALSNFSIASKLPSIIPLIFSKLNSIFLPSISETHLEEGKEQVKKYYFTMSRVSFIFGIFSFFFIALFSNSFIHLWLGYLNFVEFKLLILIAFKMMVVIIASPSGVVMTATGRFSIISRVAFFEIICIILFVIFLKFYSLSIFHILAFFTLLELIYLCFFYSIIHDYLEVKTSSALIKSFPKVIGYNIFPIIFMFLSYNYFTISSLFDLFIIGLLSFLSLFILDYLFFLNEKTEISFISFLRRQHF